MLPPTVQSLNNSILGEVGRDIMKLPSGSSVHSTASGLLYGGAGGTTDGHRTVNGIAQMYGLHDSGNINPNSIISLLADHLANPTNPSDPTPDSPSTAQGVSDIPINPETLDYLYADLAKYYGMSKETAYQEALANSSYQRAVRDMKAAGLNPAAIFGEGRGSGASGVSYVSSASPAGSGGTGRTTAKKDNLFSEGAYYGLSAAIGLLGGILSRNPTGYWIGSSASQGFMGALNAVYKSKY